MDMMTCLCNKLIVAALIACISPYFCAAEDDVPDTMLEMKLIPVPIVELPPVMKDLYDVISPKSFAEYVYERRNEILLLEAYETTRFKESLSLKLDEQLHRMQAYRQFLRNYSETNPLNEVVISLTKEAKQYRQDNDNEIDDLLRHHLSVELFDTVIDRIIRDSGPDYFEIVPIASELDLTDVQIRSLRSLRKRELSLMKESKVDMSVPNFRFPDSVRRKIEVIPAKTADILSVGQLERVWTAQGVLTRGEHISDFLVRRSSIGGFEDFVRESKLLRDLWNARFPDRKLD
jgi:hypothetical protein